METGWIAALPMYDFPELTEAHDLFWKALGEQLEQHGMSAVPVQLTRHLHHEAVWAHPRLLLGQACEYPLAKAAHTRVRLVAHPRYRVPGCAGSTYRSAIVVRAGDSAQTLSDLRGRRCIVNDLTSNSGMNLFRAAVAPIAQRAPFFDTVQISGAHRQSVEAVISGMADVAAIDCVTLAHIGRAEPDAAESLRILAWTPASPSLPFITNASSSDALLEALRSALRALTVNPDWKHVQQGLLLDGFDFAPADNYQTVRELERSASRLGYPCLQ